MPNIKIENTKSELHTHLMGMLSSEEFIKLLAKYSTSIYWPMNTSEDENRQIVDINYLFENEQAYMHAVEAISIPYGEKRNYEEGLRDLYRNRSELLSYVIKEFAMAKGVSEIDAQYYIYNDYFNRSMLELMENGVTYTEISFANEDIIKSFNLDDKLKDKINYTFLLCTQRTNPVGPSMQEKIRRAYDSGIAVGFDFMGMETPIEPDELKKTGRKSYYKKLKAVLEVLIGRSSSVLRFHSGESKGTELNTEKIFHIIDEIKEEKGYSDFPPPEFRIGHGVHYKPTEYYYDWMQKNHVIVEINASSNIALSNIDSIDDLPYIDYLNHGIPIAISTDGHGVYSTATIIEDKIAYYNYLKARRKEAYEEHLIQEAELIGRKIEK